MPSLQHPDRTRANTASPARESFASAGRRRIGLHHRRTRIPWGAFGSVCWARGQGGIGGTALWRAWWSRVVACRGCQGRGGGRHACRRRPRPQLPPEWPSTCPPRTTTGRLRARAASPFRTRPKGLSAARSGGENPHGNRHSHGCERHREITASRRWGPAGAGSGSPLRPGPGVAFPGSGASLDLRALARYGTGCCWVTQWIPPPPVPRRSMSSCSTTRPG